MRQYEDRLKKIIAENNIDAEHLSFDNSCHSVEEAARTAKANIDDLVKNICLIDAEGNLIIAIVRGDDRVSLPKINTILKSKVRIAKPEEILEKSGYMCGGVPSFGFSAKFFVDEKVLEKQIIFTGGGSENSLVRISPERLLEINRGTLCDIRK